MKTILSFIFPPIPAIFLPFTFLFIFQHSAFSQNYLMENEHSSFHSGVQIAYNSFENHYSVFPGYTYNGRWTAELGVGKTKDKINKVNSTVIRPSLSYLLVQQKEDASPISLDVNVGYQFNYVSQVSFNANALLFGAGIYHQISPIDDVKIIPGILMEGSKAISGSNQLFREKEVLAFGIQSSIVWYQYYLSPRLMVQEGIYTIGVKLGMIFS